MTTSTSIPRPPHREWPEPGPEEDDPVSVMPGMSTTWAVVLIGSFIAISAFLMWVGYSSTRDDGNTELRDKAQAVLEARFNDTSSAVPDLVAMDVYWQGDQLMVDWVQGFTVQKMCTAPVLISEDEQQFGIASFEAVPFAEQANVDATCIVTQGLEFGLPLE